MKKTIILIIFVSMLILFGCSNNKKALYTYSSEEYVDLYEYEDSSFKKADVLVTDADIEAIIVNEMLNSGYYKTVNDRDRVKSNDILLVNIDGKQELYFMESALYGEEFNKSLLNMKKETEKILKVNDTFRKVEIEKIFMPIGVDDEDYIIKFYSCNSMKEVRDFIRNRAKDEIVFNATWEAILNNTTVKSFPKEIEVNIKRRKIEDIKIIEKDNGALENYLSQRGITKEMFESSYDDFYKELMIMKAILDQEKITITKGDVDEYIDKIAIEYDTLKENVIEIYGYDIFYYEICFEKIKQIILEKVYVSS